jgi:multidrug efflux pump subunit AcrB
VRVGGAGPAIYLRDIATIENSTDIIVGYAHVDGRRTVYIPITKRAEFSTLSLLNDVRAALPRMKSVVPEDVDIRLEFEQSTFVLQSIRTLVSEAGLGALFTALVIVLFLRHLRSAIVVIVTIPISIGSALVLLWASGQTINIMTLGGLALSVGILVDQSIVAMESIHTHQAAGLTPARSILHAGEWTAGPLMTARLAILAIFLPSFFMTGVGGQLFQPLSMAVAFVMLTSYVVAHTVVPVLSAWLVRDVPKTHGIIMEAIQRCYRPLLRGVLKLRWPIVAVYFAGTAAFLWFYFPRLGTEIFPTVDTGEFQFRLRAPVGTRIERTEILALRALDIIREEVGPGNVRISTGFVGIQGSGYPVNTIYLWTTGPHEAVVKVAVTPDAALRGAELQERLRQRFREDLPETTVSFEPSDIVGQVMSMGSFTPIEVAVQGYNLESDRTHAEKIRAELLKIPDLRDLQYAQPLDYPTVHVEVDRVRAGQQGLTVANVARSLVAATASTRFVAANFWKDDTTGIAYQIQAEFPPYRMNSVDELRNVPLRDNGAQRPVLVGDVADVRETKMMGQIDRYNMQRMISMTANLHGKTLGEIAPEIRAAVARAGEPPRGTVVSVRGQIPPLEDTIAGLENGLLLSLVVIFLMLTLGFQSFRLSIARTAVVPAEICGVVAFLLVTGTTLNIQSFIGAIMALGIAGADAILLIAYAERFRTEQKMSVVEAAWTAGCTRLRPLLMVVLGMIVAMTPLAIGMGGGGEQAAPLGRAVIGGLIAATFTTMFVLPAVYAVLQRRAPAYSPSLDPDDPTSKDYEGSNEQIL